MRGIWLCGIVLAGGLGCVKKVETATASMQPMEATAAGGNLTGFDLNEYPGDDGMRRVKQYFAYTGYWLTPPPGGKATNWVGKRAVLREMGYGFLVLADGRFERQIKAAKVPAGELGRQDAARAVAAAQREGFPSGTIIFLDQEEGGRLTEAQVGYLFGWTEAMAGSGYKPGVYASGQAVPDGPGTTLTTVADIREHVAREHLHPVAVWVYQDACAPKGPAPGCVLKAPAAGASGTADVMGWQYAQSPRRPEITQSCAKTYRADGNCTPPGEPEMLMDLNVSASADPSGGR